MMEEVAAHGPQETKRMTVAGFTESQRKKDLDRIVAKMAAEGWALKEYNDAGLSASHAIFTRPFMPGIKPKGKSKLWPALVAIIVAVVALNLFGGDKTDQDKPAAATGKTSAADKMPSPPDRAMTAAVTSEDARKYIQDLDAAIKASRPALLTDNLATIAAHSRRMNALGNDGEKFGNAAFSKPYGYCFAAGNAAKDWWHQTLDVARSGKENLPGNLARTAEQYQDYRGACLEAADKESRQR